MAIRKIVQVVSCAKQRVILDADIKGFFDNVDHGILMKLVRRRIRDPRVLRLIEGWLKAGFMEDGRFHETTGEGACPTGVVPVRVRVSVSTTTVTDKLTGKAVGKPYWGKPAVRFDEGAEGIALDVGTTQVLNGHGVPREGQFARRQRVHNGSTLLALTKMTRQTSTGMGCFRR
jgi:hypothetical protein